MPPIAGRVTPCVAIVRDLMSGISRVLQVGAIASSAYLIAGCAQGSASTSNRSVTWSQTASAQGGPPANGTPIETVYDWYRAGNAKDCNRYQSYFERPDWGCKNETPPTDWQPVSDVRCLQTSLSTDAHTQVTCSWIEPPNRKRQGGNFWHIDLSLRSDHKWQIYDYGEG